MPALALVLDNHNHDLGLAIQGTQGVRSSPDCFSGLDRGQQMRIWFQQFASCSKRGSMNAGKILVERASALWRDDDGLMAPYVAVMLPVLVGFALLGVDAARRMSLQTQMQAAADSLALAGARELNKQPGAEIRAQSAMANSYASTKSPNTLFGVGPSPKLTYTFAFYSSLAAASDGIAGTATSGYADAKYLAVRVTQQTLSTILPASFLANVSTDAFAVGAEAAAGFSGTTVCSVAPLFVCNPYEAPVGSMTDAQATAALNSAIDSPAILRRQLKLNRNGIGPGHFGWLNTPDGCDNAACMATNVAGGGACYSDAGVSLAVGNTNAVEPYLDTRFDIYDQNPPAARTSANAPAVNVRKGYLPGMKSNVVDWCAAAPASTWTISYTYPSNRTFGSVTTDSPVVADVASVFGVAAGEPIVDSAGFLMSSADNPVSVSSAAGTTLTVSAQSKGTQAGDGLTIEWTTSGLLQDIAFPGLGGAQGDGEWDCADYWGINHPHGPSSADVGAALGGVCGPPDQTSVSRYQVYRYEISHGTSAGGVADWSGRNGWASNGQPDPQGVGNPPGKFQTESGAPYCAESSGVSGVDTTTGGLDRRNLIVPIINCLAQTALGNIGNAGATAATPVAAFGKFFLTQPYSALKDGNLYGEITGLVGPADNAKIFNLVQLYR
jgi:Flp pilus assembly protein TadG